jgi:protein phosphatase
VSVAALETYADPVRPFLPAVATSGPSAQQANDDLLDIDDVRGKRLITTRLHRSVTIREENAAAALEVMSRFAANPKWLIYLPPTMSPSETTKKDGLLEHPAEAFSYYRASGVPTVVVEQKHMGSRAILIVCRSKESRERFESEDEEGVCHTDGRRFCEDRRWNANSSQPFKVLSSGVASGINSRRTGCASTASSCPGRRRHSNWCASNTRRLGQQRGLAWGRLSPSSSRQ